MLDARNGYWAEAPVMLGEDAGQQRTGPQALATLRNGVLNLLRAASRTTSADALRLLGTLPDGLCHHPLPVPPPARRPVDPPNPPPAPQPFTQLAIFQ